MSIKVTTKTVKETLSERLASDGEVLKCFGEILAFFALVSSGTPIGITAGIGMLLAASASGVKATSEIIKRAFANEPGGKQLFPPYEKFRVVFYASVSRAYLEALGETLEKLKKNDRRQSSVSDEERKKLALAIKTARGRIEESEIPFLLGVNPLRGDIPFYDALSEGVVLQLEAFGYGGNVTHEVLNVIAKTAVERFQIFLASEEAEPTWIRNYLLVRTHEQTERIANDLASVRSALDAWLPPSNLPKAKRQQAWADYREHLKSLPDQKDSMYNEEFGVREVFIRPDGTYAVSGASGTAGKAQKVTDLGAVIGGLLSTRVLSSDLIILCGGPGSGKSTLCRVLASELASQPDVFPIFARLRRLKEGSDIPAFLESQLSAVGLVDRIGDLRTLRNVVIILDGFDELVMASRARLRQFFNTLREDHTNGALRGMRIIVSGRDTLFPGGEGLPVGSHVLTLLPFDVAKVAAWSSKWRSRHQGGGGSTFRPEAFLSEKAKRQSALQHLVTWPLTLHLVARVHTSGTLTVSGTSPDTLTKAILYRSILAETAKRQREQTDGKGRLEPKQMRELLRAIAWRMYEDGRDSMDPSEVLPILESFFPGKTEAELAELSDVAVVNAPEMTKGEQTGFEFVHKSFAEYLTAEQIAIAMARVTFQAPEYGSDKVSWRMTESEATKEIERFAAIRLLTAEVQEMLEPMLGDFEGFLQCAERPESRAAGLAMAIDRLEVLLEGILRGRTTRIIEERPAKATQVSSILEAMANFAAGVTLIGAAAARQRGALLAKSPKLFCLEPFDGAFWKFLCLLHAGGLYLDKFVTSRMVNGSTIVKEAGRHILDIDLPLKTAWLNELDGFRPALEEVAAAQMLRSSHLMSALQIALSALASLVPEVRETSGKRSSKEPSQSRRQLALRSDYVYEWFRREGMDLPSVLADKGFIRPEQIHELRNRTDHEVRELFRLAANDESVPRWVERIDSVSHRYWDGPSPVSALQEILHEISLRSEKDPSNWLRDALRLKFR